MKKYATILVLLLLSVIVSHPSPRKLTDITTEAELRSFFETSGENKLSNDITIATSISLAEVIVLNNDNTLDLNGKNLFFEKTCTYMFLMNPGSKLNIINSASDTPVKIYFKNNTDTNDLTLFKMRKSSLSITDTGKGMTLGIEDYIWFYIIDGEDVLNITLNGNILFLGTWRPQICIVNHNEPIYFMAKGDNSSENSQGIIFKNDEQSKIIATATVSIASDGGEIYLYGKIKIFSACTIGMNLYSSTSTSKLEIVEMNGDIESHSTKDAYNSFFINNVKKFIQEGTFNGTSTGRVFFLQLINEIEFNGNVDILSNTGILVNSTDYYSYLSPIENFTINGNFTIHSGDQTTQGSPYRGIHLDGVKSFIINGNLYSEGYDCGLYFFRNDNSFYGLDEIIINGNLEIKVLSSSDANRGIYLSQVDMTINGKKEEDNYTTIISQSEVCFYLVKQVKITTNDNVQIKCGKQIFSGATGSDEWEIAINAKIINFKSASEAEYIISFLYPSTVILNDPNTEPSDDFPDAITDQSYVIYDPLQSLKNIISMECKEGTSTPTTKQEENTETRIYQCNSNAVLFKIKDYTNANKAQMNELITNKLEVDMSEAAQGLTVISQIEPTRTSFYYDNTVVVKISTIVEIKGVEFFNVDKGKVEETVKNLVYYGNNEGTYHYFVSLQRAKTELNGKYYLNSMISDQINVLNTHKFIEIIKEPIINYVYLNEKKSEVSNFTSEHYYPKDSNLKQIILEFSDEIEEDSFNITPSVLNLNLEISRNKQNTKQLIINSAEALKTDFSLQVDHKTNENNKNIINIKFYSLTKVEPTEINYDESGDKIKIKLDYELKEDQLIKEITLVALSSGGKNFTYVLPEPKNLASTELQFTKSDDLVGKFQILTKFENENFEYINSEKIIQIYRNPLEIDKIDYISTNTYTYTLDKIKYFPGDSYLKKIIIYFKKEVESDRKIKITGEEKEYQYTIEGEKVAIVLSELIKEDKELFLIDENSFDNKGSYTKYDLSILVLTKDNSLSNTNALIQNMGDSPVIEFTSNSFTLTIQSLDPDINSLYLDTPEITQIDLGSCTNSLTSAYSLSQSDLLISQIDEIPETETTYNVDFDIYSKNGTKIDLSPCNNDEIVLTLPLTKVTEVSSTTSTTTEATSESSEYSYTDLSSGVDESSSELQMKLLDKDSDIFTKKCKRLEITPKGKSFSLDVPYKNRKSLYKERYLCDRRCSLTGFDYKSETVNCTCKGLIFSGQKTTTEKISVKIDYDEIVKSHNFYFLGCTDIMFKSDYVKKNPGFYIFLILAILILAAMIAYFVVKNKKFANSVVGQDKSSENKEEKQEDPNRGDVRNDNTQKDKVVVNVNKSKNEEDNENDADEEEGNKEENDEKEAVPEKKSESNNGRTKDLIAPENKEEVQAEEEEVEYEEVEEEAEEEENKANPPQKKGKLENDSSIPVTGSNSELMKYSSTNILEKKNETVSFCTLYGRALKIIHPIFKIIFANEMEIILVLTGLLIFEIGIQFFTNVLFYNQTVVSHNYVKETKFDFGYNIKKILLAYVIGIIIRLVITPLDITSSYLLKNKNQPKEAKNSKMIIAFFIVIFVLTCLFWYFCSAFCAVFPNNAYGLCMNSLIGIALRLIVPFVAANFYVGLRNSEERFSWLVRFVEVL